MGILFFLHYRIVVITKQPLFYSNFLLIFANAPSNLRNFGGCHSSACYLPFISLSYDQLASCMIVHFSAHILKWELVCKFGVRFSYIYYYFWPQFTVPCMKLMIFLIFNNLFIYQVLYTRIYRRCSLYSFLYDFLMLYVAFCTFVYHHHRSPV